MINTKQAGEIFLLLFFLIFFITTFISGFSISGEARLFPLIINGIGTTLIVIIAALGWYRNKDKFKSISYENFPQHDINAPRQVVVTLVLAVAYALLVNYIGLLLASIAFLSIYGYLYIDNQKYTILIILFMVLSIYFLADMLNEQQRFLRGVLLHM